MINKIICFLIGHNWYRRTNEDVCYIKNNKLYHSDICFRCGKVRYIEFKDFDGTEGGIDCDAHNDWINCYIEVEDESR